MIIMEVCVSDIVIILLFIRAPEKIYSFYYDFFYEKKKLWCYYWNIFFVV